jgi:hypothetical protein
MPDSPLEAEPRIKRRGFYKVAERHVYGRGRWFAGSDAKPRTSSWSLARTVFLVPHHTRAAAGWIYPGC